MVIRHNLYAPRSLSKVRNLEEVKLGISNTGKCCITGKVIGTSRTGN